MSPCVPREGTRVLYADRTDLAGLRIQYAGDPAVDPDRIVPVDVVWSDKPLAECLPPGTVLDYVVASHVIEHVPDLIGWLQQIAGVMRPGGRVALVIPDKRFTFDYLRAPSRLNELLDAYLCAYRRPMPWQLLDYHIHSAEVDCAAAWRGEIEPARLRRYSYIAGGLEVSRRALAGEYFDAHCWVFTPRSFLELLAELVNLDLLTFRCQAFFDTEPGTLEFRLVLERRNADLTLDKDEARASFLGHALRAGHEPPCPTPPSTASPDTEALARRLAAAEAELAAIRASRSWRALAPLRTIRRALSR